MENRVILIRKADKPTELGVEIPSESTDSCLYVLMNNHRLNWGGIILF